MADENDDDQIEQPASTEAPAPQAAPAQPASPDLAPIDNPQLARHVAQHGRASWGDDELPADNRLADLLATHARAGTSWEDTQRQIDRYFPDTDMRSMAALRHQYRLGAQQYRLQVAQQDWSGAEESPLGRYYRKLNLFGLHGAITQSRLAEANDRFRQGQATDEDLGIMAMHRRVGQLDEQEGLGQQLTDLATARLPALVIEMFTAGKVLGALGGWGQRGLAALGLRGAAPIAAGAAAEAGLPSLLSIQGLKAAATRAGASQYAAELPGYLGRLSAQTAAMPSMWLTTAASNAAEHGGKWWEGHNLAPAFGLGMMNMAVLGSTGYIAEGVTGASVGAFLKRTAARAGLGIAEQSAVDVIAGSTGLQGGFGVLGEAWQGKWDKVWQRLMVEGATFAAFGAMHEAQHGAQQPLTELARAGRDLRVQGLSRDLAGQQINGLHDALTAAVSADPLFNREKALGLVEGLTAGGSPVEQVIQRYGRSLAEQLPEQVTPPTPPQPAQPTQPTTPGEYLHPGEPAWTKGTSSEPPAAPPASATPQPAAPPKSSLREPTGERGDAKAVFKTPDRMESAARSAAHDVHFDWGTKFEPGKKGLATFTDKDGNKRTIVAVKTPYGTRLVVRDADGKPLGPKEPTYAFSRNADGTIAGEVNAHPDLYGKGKGFAAALYDYASRRYGDVRRSMVGGQPVQTALGQGMTEHNRQLAREFLAHAQRDVLDLESAPGAKSPQLEGDTAELRPIAEAAPAMIEAALRQGDTKTAHEIADLLHEAAALKGEIHGELNEPGTAGERGTGRQTPVRREAEEPLHQAFEAVKDNDPAANTPYATGEAAAGQSETRGAEAAEPAATAPTAAVGSEAPERNLTDRELGKRMAEEWMAKNGRSFLLGPNPGGGSGQSPSAPRPPSSSEKQAAVEKMLALPVAEQKRLGMATKNETLGEMGRRNAVAGKALEDAQRSFANHVENVSDPAVRQERFLEVMDAIQHGKINTLPEETRAAAEAIRAQNDAGEKLLRERDMLHTFIDNYMPQIWKEYNEAEARGTRRPWGGRQGFLKQRSIPDYRAGIEGDGEHPPLTPVSWNPAEIAMLNLREVHKAVMRHDMEVRSEALGARVYARLGQELPGGPGSFRRLKEANEAVFAPPETAQRTYVDEKQTRELENFAKDYGVDVERVQRGAPGMHEPGRITMRFGTTEENFAHEIGHEIHFRNQDEFDSYMTNPVTSKELLALANLRGEGRLSPEDKAYFHKPTEQIANLITAYFHAPQLAKEIAPVAYARLHDFFQNDPQLKQFADIKPSLVLGMREQMLKLAGPQLVGHYYYLEPFANMIDNYLSPGLRKYTAYNIARQASDGLNQAQLGMSAFHAGFEVLEGISSAMSLGLQEVTRGQVAQGIGRIGMSPLSVVKNITEGGKGIREYLKPGSTDPETAKIIDAMTSAGYRPYQDEWGSHYSQLKDALKTYKEAAGGIEKLGPAAKILWHGIGTGIEAMAHPVMGVMVPRMKTGVAMDMVKSWMDAHPGASFGDKQAAVSRIWDSTENRLGQFTYDRTNMSRATRDVLHLSVRSVGWNLGTIRELMGGLYDIPKSIRGLLKGEGITERSAYVVGMTMATGLVGYMINTLYGQTPTELKDYFFPKTGRTRPDGSADRVSLPSYMRDVFSLLNRADEGPFRVVGNLYTMAQHKVNPGLALAAEMLSNQEFYGAAIWSPRDPWMQQALDLAGHLVRSPIPFGIRGIQQNRETGARDAASMVGPFFGVTPAGANITRTSEQQRQFEEQRRYLPTAEERRRRAQLGRR